MKKLILSAFFLTTVYASMAQVVPGFETGPSGFYRPFAASRYLPDSISKKKWTLNTFAGMSTSIIGWKGGHATTFSAPVGLELDRRINNNLWAFAAVSAAPTYINFHSSFLNTDFSKGCLNSFSRTNQMSIFPKAELGLKYVNDARTFEISGSMSVQRVPDYYYPIAPVTTQNRN